jgi:hypothetical protein
MSNKNSCVVDPDPMDPQVIGLLDPDPVPDSDPQLLQYLTKKSTQFQKNFLYFVIFIGKLPVLGYNDFNNLVMQTI